jgi:hypothetical protein
MRQSTGSDIRVSAWDDADGDNIVHTGDTQQAITGITISYNGASSGDLTPTGTLQHVTVGGVTFDYQLDADGKSVLINNVQGNTGANETPATTISVHTASGYEELQVDNVSGDTFKFSGFGAVETTIDPLNLTVPVTVIDGDGDTVSGGNLVIHADAPASGGGAAVVNTMMATSSLLTSSTDTSSLVSTNDNHRGPDEHRAGNNAALLGAIAAAGLASSQELAAETAHGPASHGSHSDPIVAPQALPETQFTVQDNAADESSVQPAIAPASGQQAATSHLSSGSDAANAHGLAGHETAAHQVVTQLLSGTEGHGASHSAAAVTAASIAIPSAEQQGAGNDHRPVLLNHHCPLCGSCGPAGTNPTRMVAVYAAINCEPALHPDA